MGLRQLAGLLVLGGCQHVFGVDAGPSPDAAEIDAAIDAPVLPDARSCFGHDDGPFLQVCLDEVPDEALDLDGPIATNVDLACRLILPHGMGSEICVVSARTIRVTGNVRVTGTRALILLATESLEIAATGTLDAAGRSGNPPAGVPFPGCAGSAGRSANALAGAGGAGGSFVLAGGPGGTGGDATVLGGQPSPPQVATLLRAGCGGTDGGRMNQTAPGGGGGGGRPGGAVYLLAGERLTIQGVINASGAGGDGGPINRGGGGGGAGGMIVLEAPTLQIDPSARVFAIGGGGGGGGGDAGGANGGASSGPSNMPLGGLGGGSTAIGGAGGRVYRAMAGATGAKGTLSGGGGGGGSIGVIRMYPLQPTTTATVDPPAT